MNLVPADKEALFEAAFAAVKGIIPTRANQCSRKSIYEKWAVQFKRSMLKSMQGKGEKELDSLNRLIKEHPRLLEAENHYWKEYGKICDTHPDFFEDESTMIAPNNPGTNFYHPDWMTFTLWAMITFGENSISDMHGVVDESDFLE